MSTIARKPLLSRLTPAMTIAGVNAALTVVFIVTGALCGNDAVSRWIVTNLDLKPSQAFMTTPWTLVTYSWVQTDIMHCLCNMLLLYWCATLLMQHASSRAVWATYLAGGIAGGVLYIAASAVWPHSAGAALQGASAAVIATMAALTVVAPKLRVNIFPLRNVELRWFALGAIILLALVSQSGNTGGHAAHAGGLAAGIAAGAIMRYKLRRPTPPVRALTDAQARELLDKLLDKVHTSGYNSLSIQERQLLQKLSQRI